MKRKLTTMLLAVVIVLGLLSLSACDGAENGGHTDRDPVAVMNKRVKAVNDALDWECIGIEAKIEAGLLFYGLYSPALGETRDHNSDKPLDYSVGYWMFKRHTKGIVSEDTYVPLLRAEWSSLEEGARLSEFSAEDVIETDNLYVWYGGNSTENGNLGECLILVKGTDILYFFLTIEGWSGDGYHTGDDVEYIFTTEFWKAFAQTAKFAGKADDDFNDNEYIYCEIGIGDEGVTVSDTDSLWSRPQKPLPEPSLMPPTASDAVRPSSPTQALPPPQQAVADPTG